MSLVGKLPADLMDRAKKLRDRLCDLSEELVYLHFDPDTGGPKNQELARFDIETSEQAAEIIAVLGTEVTRLRLGIQHLYYGRMTEKQLLAMTENWNGDPVSEPEPDSLESLGFKAISPWKEWHGKDGYGPMEEEDAEHVIEVRRRGKSDHWTILEAHHAFWKHRGDHHDIMAWRKVERI